MKDLQSARLIYLKAALFVVLGVVSASMLFAQSPRAMTLLVIAVCVWSFARAYYFAFYVIERYVDRSFRFSGLFAFIRHVTRRREAPSFRDDLLAREPIFHRPELGTSRADFERMTADSFWEIGASGRRYDRAYVLDELEKRFAAPYADDWQVQDFQCRELAPGNYLVTYTLVQNGTRMTRRSTVWRRTDEGYEAVYHQGTVVA